MKTSNVKVKVQDVKAGKVIYISHPVYGIEKKIITSKPYRGGKGGLFADCYDDWMDESNFSLCDAGIGNGNSYSGRRAFFKLKQAQEWANKWKNDKGFIKSHEEHEEAWREMDDFYIG